MAVIAPAAAPAGVGAPNLNDPQVVAAKIKAALPDAAVSANAQGISVNRNHIVAVTRYLRDDPELSLDYLANLTSVDWPDRIEVVYHLTSITRLPESGPASIVSMTPFSTAGMKRLGTTPPTRTAVQVSADLGRQIFVIDGEEPADASPLEFQVAGRARRFGHAAAGLRRRPVVLLADQDQQWIMALRERQRIRLGQALRANQGAQGTLPGHRRARA